MYGGGVVRANAYVQRMWDDVLATHSANLPSKHISIIHFLVDGEKAILKILRDTNMASKRSTQSFEFKGYVNIEIDDAVVGQLEKFCADGDKVLLTWGKAVQEGYSIRQSYDQQTQSIRTNITCLDAKSPNHGKSLGAWAKEPYMSLAVCLFKHEYIAKGVWGDTRQSNKRSFG